MNGQNFWEKNLKTKNKWAGLTHQESCKLRHWCRTVSHVGSCKSQPRDCRAKDSWLGSGWYWGFWTLLNVGSWTWLMKAMQLSGLTKEDQQLPLRIMRKDLMKKEETLGNMWTRHPAAETPSMSSTAFRGCTSSSTWLTRLAWSGPPLSIHYHSFPHHPHLPTLSAFHIHPHSTMSSHWTPFSQASQACTSWGWEKTYCNLRIALSSSIVILLFPALPHCICLANAYLP